MTAVRSFGCTSTVIAVAHTLEAGLGRGSTVGICLACIVIQPSRSSTIFELNYCRLIFIWNGVSGVWKETPGLSRPQSLHVQWFWAPYFCLSWKLWVSSSTRRNQRVICNQACCKMLADQSTTVDTANQVELKVRFHPWFAIAFQSTTNVVVVIHPGRGTVSGLLACAVRNKVTSHTCWHICLSTGLGVGKSTLCTRILSGDYSETWDDTQMNMAPCE